MLKSDGPGKLANYPIIVLINEEQRQQQKF
jgi:hypothetical protein